MLDALTRLGEGLVRESRDRLAAEGCLPARARRVQAQGTSGWLYPITERRGEARPVAPPEPGSRLGALAEGAVAEGTPYLTLSTVPRYWFYPEIFRDVPGQGASPRPHLIDVSMTE